MPVVICQGGPQFGLVVGRLGGRSGLLDLDEVARKRLRILGVSFRTRSREEKLTVVERYLGSGLSETGLVRQRVHRALALGEAENAHRTLADDDHVGKLVLRPELPDSLRSPARRRRLY